MVAVPAALGVKVTEQLPLTNVQLVALKVPARPVAVKATEPAGVVAPAPLVSATVAVQVDVWLIGREAGMQTVGVEVVGSGVVTGALVDAPLELAGCKDDLGVTGPVT